MIHRNCVRVQAFVHACKCVRLFPLHSIYIGQTLPGTECALQATHAIWCVCVCVCVGEYRGAFVHAHAAVVLLVLVVH